MSLGYLLIKEAVTLGHIGSWKYFTSVWKILDIISIILNFAYTVFEIMNYLPGA